MITVFTWITINAYSKHAELHSKPNIRCGQCVSFSGLYALSLNLPQVFHLFTLRRNCVYFLSLASFALHREHPTLCNNSGFVFLFFFHFFFSTFSACSIFDKFTARCYPQPLLFFFSFFFSRAAQTQSAPIKHKVLFSPVDVVIPPTLENWQKQQWKQYSMLPSLELKKNSPVSQSKLYNSVKSTVHLQVNFIFLITFHLFYFSSSFSPHTVSFQKKERKCVKQYEPLIVIYNVYCITMYSTSCSGKVREAR